MAQDSTATDPVDTEDDNTGFEFTVDDAGPARKRLTIVVTSDMVDSKLTETMGSLQSEAALPGFRKGRAPKHLIERRFGSGVKEDARNHLVSEAYQRCLKANDLQPLSDPEPVDADMEIVLEPGKPMSFAVEVEVMPAFELPDFSSMSIKKPMLEVEESHIDAELERQCLRHGNGEELQDGLTTQDRLLGSAVLRIVDEPKPLFESGRILLVLPGKGEAGAVLGLMVDDLAKTFAKAKVGETLTLKATGPEGHEREDIRGKDLEIAFTIDVAERITPCSNQDLIDTFSLASEDVLREQIRLALEQQRDEEQQQVLREQAMEAAMETIEMELPKHFSDVQIGRDLERVRMEMLQRGVEPEDIETKLAEVRDRSIEQSQHRMKGFFLISRVAIDNEIQVSEQDINGAIASMAMRQNMRPDQLRSELAKQDRLQQLGMSIRDRKTMAFMAEQMKQVDVSAEAWQKHQDET